MSTNFFKIKLKIFYFIINLLFFYCFSGVDGGCTAKRSQAGCQQLRLCCSGQNQTCKINHNFSYNYDVHKRCVSSHNRYSRSSNVENTMLKLFQFKAKKKFPIVVTRRKKKTIGSLILPNLIALNNVGQKYARKYGLKGYLQVVERNVEYKNVRKKRKVKKVKRQSNLTHSIEDYFVFGSTVELNSPKENLMQKSRPIIKYSLLNKYLPLRIGKTRHVIKPTSIKAFNQSYSRRINQETNDDLKVMYVTELEAQCYCDSACIMYNDCCFDYVQYCKPVIPEPCYFSQWSSWSECRASNPNLNKQVIYCGGKGIQYRSRKVIRGSENIACTRRHLLTENRGCFEICKQNLEYNEPITFKQKVINTSWDSNKMTSTTVPQQMFNNSMKNTKQNDSFAYGPHKSGADQTTVALLLDYRYNKTRMVNHKYEYLHKPLLYHSQLDNHKTTSQNATNNFKLLPEADYRFEKDINIFYCIRYELGWVNRNCFGRDWQKMLYQKNIICVECQPNAQLHRNTPRCTSDLQDGEKGFWKLIGPRYCYGIWRRISRTDNCYCYRNFPQLPPFLIV